MEAVDRKAEVVEGMAVGGMAVEGVAMERTMVKEVCEKLDSGSVNECPTLTNCDDEALCILVVSHNHNSCMVVTVGNINNHSPMYLHILELQSLHREYHQLQQINLTTNHRKKDEHSDHTIYLPFYYHSQKSHEISQHH